MDRILTAIIISAILAMAWAVLAGGFTALNRISSRIGMSLDGRKLWVIIGIGILIVVGLISEEDPANQKRAPEFRAVPSEANRTQRSSAYYPPMQNADEALDKLSRDFEETCRSGLLRC